MRVIAYIHKSARKGEVASTIIDSLRDQVDTYSAEPELLVGLESDGDLILLCSDRWIYPPDYVENILKTFERYHEQGHTKVLLTFGGRHFICRGPIGSYERSPQYRVRPNERQPWDIAVSVPDAGCCAFIAGTISVDLPINPDNPNWVNMDDVLLARQMKDQKVNIVCAAHPENYIIPVSDLPEGPFDEDRDFEATILVNYVYQ